MWRADPCRTACRGRIVFTTNANFATYANLQQLLADITRDRDTVFKGETLRGLLLTSYGFSEFGAKASQAATVVVIGAALLALLAIAGFVHALRTPKSKTFAAPERDTATPDGKTRTGI